MSVLKPRRITFQLVSLFDLLIIVVFAQYLDMGQKTKEKQSAAEQKLVTLTEQTEMLSRLQQELSRAQRAHDELQAQVKSAAERGQERETQLESDLDAARAELLAAGKLLASFIKASQSDLQKAIKSGTGPNAEQAQQEWARLSQSTGPAAVQHLLTWVELLKRMDLWQMHIAADNSITLRAADRTIKFRATSSERFTSEMLRNYRTLPQPKSLVLILLSWGDAELSTRAAATKGLEQLVERLREETDRRTRFDFAVLGFIPDE